LPWQRKLLGAYVLGVKTFLQTHFSPQKNSLISMKNRTKQPVFMLIQKCHKDPKHQANPALLETLLFQTHSVSPENLALHRNALCELSHLRCHGHSLLLSVIYMQDRKNSFCSDFICRILFTFLTVLHLSLSDLSFSTLLQLSVLGSKPWSMVRLLLGLREVSPYPYSSEGGQGSDSPPP